VGGCALHDDTGLHVHAATAEARGRFDQSGRNEEEGM